MVTTSVIGCVEKDPYEKGLNKIACDLDPENCYFDENCYRLNRNGF